MKNIVGIKFDAEPDIQYYFIENMKVKKNINIIANTERGLELGYVATDVHPIDDTKLNKNLPKILRVATKKDFNSYLVNKKQASIALKKCKTLVSKMKLEMNIIECFFTLNRDRLIFNFYSENRVDFRNLAKELAFIYKTRIELRQIGVRDKAKKISGVGICGQKLCCSRFLKQFDSVSISMAKNQNLSLNPNKINGSCGRLLCCLRYEDDVYRECNKKLPKIGQAIETKNGKGIVQALNILNQTYKIQLDNGNIIEEEVKNGNNQ